jgi:hypothetical protein
MPRTYSFGMRRSPFEASMCSQQWYGLWIGLPSAFGNSG